MELAALTGAELAEVATPLKPCPASLGQWRPAAATALAGWYPQVFEELAQMLDIVERTGVWPHSLAAGYTALVPKSGGAISRRRRSLDPSAS